MRASAAGALLAGAGTTLLVAGQRASRAHAQTDAMDPAVAAMLREAFAHGRAVREGTLSPTAWQDAMPGVLGRVSVEAIARALDLPRLRARARPVARGCATLALPFPDELGADEGAAMRVFFFEAGRTDPPHVHFNSVTTHLVLEGRFQVRHWDRVREQARDAARSTRGHSTRAHSTRDHSMEGAGFVLRETHDRTIEPGESTSISEPRDNGHWHQCLSRGVLLDIEQGRLDPSIPPRHRQMVDLAAATREGEFFAPALSNTLALRRYG